MGAPEVQFIVMPKADDGAWRVSACKVVEEAYLRGDRVLVRCGSADQAQTIDELLWRFSDSAFVPHEIAAPGRPGEAPVVLWSEGEPQAGADVLVNLAVDVPPWYDRFARIVEVLDGDEERRRAGRARYRFYRAQGIEPQTRDIGAGP